MCTCQPALRRLIQKSHYRFKAGLLYTLSSRLVYRMRSFSSKTKPNHTLSPACRSTSVRRVSFRPFVLIHVPRFDLITLYFKLIPTSIASAPELIIWGCVLSNYHYVLHTTLLRASRMFSPLALSSAC